MQIVFVNGRELTLVWHELRALLWHPWFVALVLVTNFVIILLRPYGDLVGLEPPEKVLFYANGVGSFLALLVLAFRLCMWGRLRIFTVPLLIVSVVGATIWGLWFAHLLGAPQPHLPDILLVSTFNLIFAVLAEIILVSFLLDKICSDLGLGNQGLASRRAGRDEVANSANIGRDVAPAEAPTAAPAVAETVEILGRRFLASEVWLLTAEEHYVSICLVDGKSVLLRGNMSDAVATLPQALGIRTHRSFWVARQAIDTLMRSSKGWRITLRCGAQVPVARSRQAEISGWIDLPGQKKAPRGAPLSQPK